MVGLEDVGGVAGFGDCGAAGAGPFYEDVFREAVEGGGAGEGAGVEHCFCGWVGVELRCLWRTEEDVG